MSRPTAPGKTVQTPGNENCCYILRCADGTLYTGWTNRLEERVAAHSAGKGAKYTRGRRPVELVYCERFATKEEAMSREYHIKKMTRTEKLKLIGQGALASEGGSVH